MTWIRNYDDFKSYRLIKEQQGTASVGIKCLEIWNKITWASEDYKSWIDANKGKWGTFFARPKKGYNGDQCEYYMKTIQFVFKLPDSKEIRARLLGDLKWIDATQYTNLLNGTYDIDNGYLSNINWYICDYPNFVRLSIEEASAGMGTWEEEIARSIEFLDDEGNGSMRYKQLVTCIKTYKCNGFSTLEGVLSDELGDDDVNELGRIKKALEKCGQNFDYTNKNNMIITPLENSETSNSTESAASTGGTASTEATSSSGATSSTEANDPCAKYKPKGTNENVKLLQQKLKDLGFLEAEPDGKYGPKTQEAVGKFQEKYEINPPYGCYGPITAKKLKEIGGDYIPFYGDKQDYSKGETPTNTSGQATAQASPQTPAKGTTEEEQKSIMPDDYK